MGVFIRNIRPHGKRGVIVDIMDFIANVNNVVPELLDSYCFVNGAIMPLDEVDKMGYNEFSVRSKINMPQKLYRYFPNIETKQDDKSEVNYSQIALRENTVFMQAPCNFDDVYDSDINIDYMTYQKYRLLAYCKRCGSNMDESHTIEELGNEFIRLIMATYDKYHDLDHFFVKAPESDFEKLSNENFRLSLNLEILKDNRLGCVIPRIIEKDYKQYIENLKNTFRVSCFTTSPYSQLMWASYANFHRGLCVEYTILPNDEQYRDVYLNLFPVIYCKKRQNVSKYLVTQLDRELDMERLWTIYSQGALRKSFDWMYQCEWRLILPFGRMTTENFNIRFFPITKVFLGNRMQTKQRKEIVDICKSKKIPYVGMVRNPYKFEMEECEGTCEACNG